MRPTERLQRSWRSLGYDLKLGDLNHGDLATWIAAVDALPSSRPSRVCLGDVVAAGVAADIDDPEPIRRVIRTLVPWRKGPFRLFGEKVDSEWRSDRKWARIKGHVDLADKVILDVGCGNGYYGWRMLEAGAARVVGVDPTLLFVMQHAVIAHFMAGPAAGRAEGANLVLPIRFGEGALETSFDVVFSMGVFYHQRDPHSHLAALAAATRAGGTLILESLVTPAGLVPENRYARMRNVWSVPSIEELRRALAGAGFTEPTAVDIALTRTIEQRRTAVMPYESLESALDPGNPLLTIEGYPAPVRAVITARKR